MQIFKSEHVLRACLLIKDTITELFLITNFSTPLNISQRFFSTFRCRLDSHIFKRRFFTISTRTLVPLESECQRFALRFTANGEIRNVGHDSLHFFFFFFSLPRLLPPFSTVSFQIFRAQNDNRLIRAEKRERKEFNYLHQIFYRFV